jgi:hypothetical protein
MRLRPSKTSEAAKAIQDDILKGDDSISGDIEDGKSSHENSSSNGHSSSNLSSSNPSTTDFGSKATNEEPAAEVCAVTKQDTKNVNRTKFLVYLSLLLAAVTVGSLTYILTAKKETYTFQVEVR